MIRKLPPQAALSYIRKGAGYEEYLRLYAIENNIPMSGLLKQLEQLAQECSKFNTLEQWINSIDSDKIVKVRILVKRAVEKVAQITGLIL